MPPRVTHRKASLYSNSSVLIERKREWIAAFETSGDGAAEIRQCHTKYRVFKGVLDHQCEKSGSEKDFKP